MKLAIFDLDYTIWQPEMYQLYGEPKLTSIDAVQTGQAGSRRRRAGAVGDGGLYSEAALKEMKTNRDGMVLVDDGGSPMRVFPGASYALADINRLRSEGHDITAAVASRTDEPHWAKICLRHLVIEDGSTLDVCFGNSPQLVQIGGGSKVGHITRLHRHTGIDYKDMAFFDNESWNIKDVRKGLPDVECVYTPHGMTRDAWDQCKRKFGLP